MMSLSAIWHWIDANWLTLFTAWVVANTLLSPISAKLSPAASATWWGKALHAFVGISPMDFMKAIKAVGGSLVPPSAGSIVTMVGLVIGLTVLPGCGSSTPASTTPAVDPRALAHAGVALVETAWKDAAQACLDAANAQHDDTIRQKCEPPLTKVRQGFLTAQAAVDVWDAAAQKNFPCLLASATEGLVEVSALGSFKIPQALTDALSLAQSYAGQCTSLASDAGGQ